MEAIGTIIVLAALAALVISIWGLIKPAGWMQVLRITTRKHAALLLAGAFVALIVGGAMLPSPEEDGGQEDEAVAAQEASQDGTHGAPGAAPRGGARGTTQPAEASPTPTRTATPRATATPTSVPRQEAQVVEVVDGDTIKVLMGGRQYTLRYIGIDTPETVDPNSPKECFGEEASARNRELVGGKTVQLEKDVSETDRYGRLLRYVYVDGQIVNETLVREGFAVVSTFPPDVRYADRFLGAEQEAREAGRGLWGTCGGADTPLPPPPPPPPPAPPPAPSGGGGGGGAAPPPPAGNCHPSYPGVCIPPPPPDLDCGDIPYRRFPVLPPDPHRFDSDGDGIGCES